MPTIGTSKFILPLNSSSVFLLLVKIIAILTKVTRYVNPYKYGHKLCFKNLQIICIVLSSYGNAKCLFCLETVIKRRQAMYVPVQYCIQLSVTEFKL